MNWEQLGLWGRPAGSARVLNVRLVRERYAAQQKVWVHSELCRRPALDHLSRLAVSLSSLSLSRLSVVGPGALFGPACPPPSALDRREDTDTQTLQAPSSLHRRVQPAPHTATAQRQVQRRRGPR